MVENEINDIEDILDSEDESIESMYLTFKLGSEVYGIEITYVTEIVGIQRITEVPDLPDFVKGVVNLRGQVIPVIDMRLRFGMDERSYDERTCIIVVNIHDVKLGLLVDTVNEVLTIEDDSISMPPNIGANQSAKFIKGMGKVGDEVKILLDGPELLLNQELSTIS